MFWADRIADEFLASPRGKGKERLVLRDEKTMSGRVHVGSMRSVALHGALSEVLTERGVAHDFLYEVNDFDAFDSVPAYLDKEKFTPHLGKPLFAVPSPDDSAPNYAEYFAKEYCGVITASGFAPSFYRSSEKYRSGAYNDLIRTALMEAAKIREIYKRASGSDKSADWLPFQVICEKCGKLGTTKVSGFDGEKVTYECQERGVEWAQGCGNKGEVSPFDGNGKLVWKVEWAAKFVLFNVDLEGAGKDHYTKGGARELANIICEEVFKHPHPFDVPHEFILVGGKKMSSSKGQGSSAAEVASLLPPHLFRYFLFYREINRTIDFVPDGDTIPVLFDAYDKAAESHWSGVEDDVTRIFRFAHIGKETPRRFLPRFSLVAFLVQMPHLDLLAEVEKMKGSPLTPEDRAETELRARYARLWLERYAPEDYRYELAKELPEAARNLSEGQKKAAKGILEYIEANPVLDGQLLHTALHELRKSLGLEAQEFFSAIYLSFLGKPSGPKAGWFLSVLDRGLLLSRLREASS